MAYRAMKQIEKAEKVKRYGTLVPQELSCGYCYYAVGDPHCQPFHYGCYITPDEELGCSNCTYRGERCVWRNEKFKKPDYRALRKREIEEDKKKNKKRDRENVEGGSRESKGRLKGVVVEISTPSRVTMGGIPRSEYSKRRRVCDDKKPTEGRDSIRDARRARQEARAGHTSLSSTAAAEVIDLTVSDDEEQPESPKNRDNQRNGSSEDFMPLDLSFLDNMDFRDDQSLSQKIKNEESQLEYSAFIKTESPLPEDIPPSTGSLAATHPPELVNPRSPTNAFERYRNSMSTVASEPPSTINLPSEDLQTRAFSHLEAIYEKSRWNPGEALKHWPDIEKKMADVKERLLAEADTSSEDVFRIL